MRAFSISSHSHDHPAQLPGGDCCMCAACSSRAPPGCRSIQRLRALPQSGCCAIHPFIAHAEQVDAGQDNEAVLQHSEGREHGAAA